MILKVEGAFTLKQISELIDTGKLKVDVAKIYALNDAALAWENIARNRIKNPQSQTYNATTQHGKHVMVI